MSKVAVVFAKLADHWRKTEALVDELDLWVQTPDIEKAEYMYVSKKKFEEMHKRLKDCVAIHTEMLNR